MNLDLLRVANYDRNEKWAKRSDKDVEFSLSYRGLELSGELGEFNNKIKKLVRENMGLPGSRTNLQEVAEEAADVLICLDLVCMNLGIDLSKAVQEKFNKTSQQNDLGVVIDQEGKQVPFDEYYKVLPAIKKKTK